jgi:hypothetical protein
MLIGSLFVPLQLQQLPLRLPKKSLDQALLSATTQTGLHQNMILLRGKQRLDSPVYASVGPPSKLNATLAPRNSVTNSPQFILPEPIFADFLDGMGVALQSIPGMCMSSTSYFNQPARFAFTSYRVANDSALKWVELMQTQCKRSIIYRCFDWAAGAELAHTYQAMMISLLANRCFAIRESPGCKWKIVPGASHARSYSAFFQPFWPKSNWTNSSEESYEEIEEAFNVDSYINSKNPVMRISLRAEVDILSSLKWEDGVSEMLQQRNEHYRAASNHVPAKIFLHGGITRYLWRPRLWVQHETLCRMHELNLQPGQYIGVHIRRGDKVSGGSKEAEAVATDVYIQKTIEFFDQNRNINTVYVASDTQAVVEEFCEMLSQAFFAKFNDRSAVCVYDKRELRTGGWIPFFEDKDASGSDEAAASRIVLTSAPIMTNINVLALSAQFVGTRSSMFFRLVEGLRNYENCASLDCNPNC